MLADFIEQHRQDILSEVESRAAIDEAPDAENGRHERIAALVEELIASLRQGGRVSLPPTDDGTFDGALECQERDLLRLDVIEHVGRHGPTVTPSELAIVCDWASAAERERWRRDYSRLSELLDDVDGGAAILDSDARLQYVNRQLALTLQEATSVPVDQLVGKSVTELHLAPRSTLARTSDEILLLARRQATVEALVQGHSLEAKYRAIYASSGEVASVAVVTRDVCEAKRARIRLRLLSKLNALIGCVDYDGVARALAGVPIPELADWCVVNLVEDGRIRQTFIAQRDPARAQLRDAAMHAVCDWSSHPLWEELRLTSGFQLLTHVSPEFLARIGFDEEEHRLLVSAGARSIMVQPVQSRGQIAAILTLVYTSDSGRRYDRHTPPLAEELALHAAHVIEDARLKRDLRESEARFRASLLGSRAAVFAHDDALRYVWFHGPDPALQPLGKTDEHIFPPDEAAQLMALKRRALEGESVSTEVSLTIDGESRRYREVLEPTRDRAGKVSGVLGSATDVTEETHTQAQLREALRFRDEILGILGHDLRDPLTAVAVTATTLLRQCDLAEPCRGRLEIIKRAVDRMTEMITTLLDVTRLRAQGRMAISTVPMDLGVLAREVVEESRAAEPGRTVDVELRGDLHGQWDPGRVAEAISNLVTNALHHGDPRKPVKLWADGLGAEVTLKVQNEGPPIPAELMSVLFEPFTRGTSGPRTRGLGLGLYIVKQVALAHGGRVDVESSAEAGTIFTVVLPR
jgi:signal transduction histidine kinase